MHLQAVTWQQLDPCEREALLRRPAVADDASIRATAQRIIDEVRADGDAAVRRITKQIDRIAIDDLRITPGEIDAASAALDAGAVAAIDAAISNVRAFHEAQMPGDLAVETLPGVRCERVSRPIDAVGLYVPAGTAPLPSAAIMLAVPAAIAGCPKRVLCTPPRPDGRANAAVLVAATRAGVNEIFKIGGAQAIAAMAYGTESVPKVNKVFGPGNAWVTAAKAIAAADPAGAAIDMPAGPSEVLVVADRSASPEFVAADLLSQAEHGADSQVVLVTDDEAFARDVGNEIKRQLGTLGRAEIARQALTHARAIVVDTIATAIDVANRYAPEHLILQCENARSHVTAVRNAGSVFVGPWTPESVGDYCSGANHVLPTYGYARNHSGLGVDQFLRQMTVQELSRDGLEALRDTTVTLARLEGLDAHAAAVTRRLEPGR